MNEMATTERNFKWPDTRLNWNDHVEKLIHRDEFEHTNRMSLVAFQKLLLLEILRPAISVNLVQSRNSVPDSDPIYPELIMHIGL